MAEQIVRRGRLLVTAFLIVVLGLVLGCHHSRQPSRSAADPLEVIPPRWIDLPDAPFVARIVGGKAVLVNRSDRDLSSVTTGCVVEQEGRTTVVGKLCGQSISNNGFRPGRPAEGLLRFLNNIDWFIANQEMYVGSRDLIKPCPEDARFAVVDASSSDLYTWSAEGTPWPK